MPTDTTDSTTCPIQLQHVTYLDQRAVPLAVAVAAGVLSVDKEQARQFLHLDIVPAGGLLFPYVDETGAAVYHRVRLLGPETNPNTPRFLAPPSTVSDVRPYFPPESIVASAVWSGSDPIYVVEGPVKALALSSVGFPAIGLGGASVGGHDVEKYRESRDLRPHRDLLRRVNLRQRRVTIVFDAGRLTNSMVAHGEAMLARALISAGAEVRVACLSLHDGNDQGPDDYLARCGRTALAGLLAEARTADPLALARQVSTTPGSGRADALAALLDDLPFLAAAQVAPPQALDLIASEFQKARISKTTIKTRVKAFRLSMSASTGTADPTEGKFKVTDKGIFAVKIDPRSGERYEDQLSNFDARIEQEIERDDGVEIDRRFGIRLTLEDGRTTPIKMVKAIDFATMNWTLEAGGVAACINHGFGAKDSLREAIQRLSDPLRRTYYTHLGWREIDGEWRYLHAGGAVGGGGNADIDLASPFDRFLLPDVTEDLVGAVRMSLELLRCGPIKTMGPLWAITYLAPLTSIIEPDFVPWLWAPSGKWKSTVAAVAQAHYGPFERKTLPLSWEATANSIEAHLFTAKDALFTVDDYAPRRSQADQREIEKHAVRVVRQVGNRQGRGRMRQDTSLRPARPPRGIILSTGEDLPPGFSINARLYVIPVDCDELDKARFTALQANAGRLTHAMRGYLEWLAPQMPTLRTSLREAHRQAQVRAQESWSGHLRMPETVAHLFVGLDVGLQFATEVGAISLQEAEEFRTQGFDAFIAGAVDQGLRVQEEDPAVLFISKIRMLLTQGRILLLPKDQKLADAAGGRSLAIGWRDDTRAYILPEAARDAVSRVYHDEGLAMPSERLLSKALETGGFIVTNQGRLTSQLRLGGQQHRVYQFSLATFGIGPEVVQTTTAATGGASPGTPSPGGAT